MNKKEKARLEKMLSILKVKWEAMTNRELLDEYLSYCQPDDYDGCWTKTGLAQADLIAAILEKRLKEIGFLE